MRIAILSDTHSNHWDIDVPDADILIHCGDFLGIDSLTAVEDFNDFLLTLPHEHKIVIAGNHDFPFERKPEEAIKLLSAATYLIDSAVVIGGIKFYGAPWTPRFFDWAFMGEPHEMKLHWEKIPYDTDVLITHGPPMGILDMTVGGVNAGCQELLDVVSRIQPSYHLFGHIHESYGIVNTGITTFINASGLNVAYQPENQPIVIEIQEKR